MSSTVIFDILKRLTLFVTSQNVTFFGNKNMIKNLLHHILKLKCCVLVNLW